MAKLIKPEADIVRLKETASEIVTTLICHSLHPIVIRYAEFPFFCTLDVDYNGKRLGRIKIDERYRCVRFVEDGMEMMEELWALWQEIKWKVCHVAQVIGYVPFEKGDGR